MIINGITYDGSTMEIVSHGSNVVLERATVTDLQFTQDDDYVNYKDAYSEGYFRAGRMGPRYSITMKLAAEKVLDYGRKRSAPEAKAPDVCHVQQVLTPAPEDALGFDVTVKVGNTLDVRRLHAEVWENLELTADKAAHEFRNWILELMRTELKK